MFTICPGCTRQFRIYAEHIAAASGQVRCGFCHQQFNALNRLHDEPLSNESILNDVQLAPELDKNLEVEPDFDISENVEAEYIEPEQDILISNTKANINQELDTAIEEIGIHPTVEEIKNDVQPELIEEEQSEPNPEPEPETKTESIIEKPKETHYEFPEPEELLEQPKIKRSGWLAAFWVTASFIALIAIVVQLVWFNRDAVLDKYPQFTPYVRQVCQELGCKLIRQRDAREITLVNRDVRLHPGFQDTLLVNATMKNDLAVRQPYPRVQLTLFDTSGALLGYREFAPDDYLDNSIAIDEGMPVDYPVHFVLEVSGPTAGAVSFEFRFL